MHIGRSHHAIFSALGGLAASFVVFAAATAGTGMQFRGQLMAGDPAANRELPTTLNAFQGAIDGTNPMLSAMSSYAWWVMVLIGALIATPVIFRLTRRFI